MYHQYDPCVKRYLSLDPFSLSTLLIPTILLILYVCCLACCVLEMVIHPLNKILNLPANFVFDLEDNKYFK